MEQRISLQYNIDLLKKLKLNDGEAHDVEIAIKRGGIIQKEVVTFRKEDKNIPLTIKKLKDEMATLDGTLRTNGAIKERIVRQAMLKDMLTITQREVEYVAKNSAAGNEEVARELAALNALLKNSDFEPSSYGVYKINNQAFISEFFAASKIGAAYKTITSPITKIKSIAAKFFADKTAAPAAAAVGEDAGAVVTEVEKMNILGRIYAKITSITPKQISLGGVAVVAGGIGVERYFVLKNGKTTEMAEPPQKNVMTSEDVAHKQQLEKTKEVEAEKSKAGSHVVEVEMDKILPAN